MHNWSCYGSYPYYCKRRKFPFLGRAKAPLKSGLSRSISEHSDEFPCLWQNHVFCIICLKALWWLRAVELLKCIPSLKCWCMTPVSAGACCESCRDAPAEQEQPTAHLPLMSWTYIIYWQNSKRGISTFLAETILIKNPGICNGIGFLIAFPPPKAWFHGKNNMLKTKYSKICV